MANYSNIIDLIGGTPLLGLRTFGIWNGHSRELFDRSGPGFTGVDVLSIVRPAWRALAGCACPTDLGRAA